MPIDRIDGIGGPGRPDRPDGGKGGRVRRQESAQDPGGDRVELSDAARLAARLDARASELPAIREQRVAAVREALAEGTYNVRSQQLARAILEFERGLDG